MPAGLDGFPDPVRTPERDAVLATVAAALPAGGRRIVAVDGESGSGKSTFADELAARLGGEAVRASIDSFHHPRRLRLPAGMDLAESYVDRSHDLDALRSRLLDPFRDGAPTVRTAAFDEPSDAPVDAPPVAVGPDAVLVLDGLFLLRSELRERWDVSVLLVSPARALAEAATLRPELVHRYLDGWRLYVDRCDPAAAATFVIDNRDLAAPAFL